MGRFRERAAHVAWPTCLLVLLASTPTAANLSRNTSSASTMGAAGEAVLDTAGQRESDSDGEAWVVETGIQYGLTARLEMVLEAAVFEQQDADSAKAVSGVGDTDITLSYLILAQNFVWPALVVGAKVKLPTADDDLGTEKVDVSALVALSNEWGPGELNLELELATFGSPMGEELRDQFIYTFAVDVDLTENLAAYTEFFGNTKPTEREGATSAAKLGLELDIPISAAVSPYVSTEIDTEGLFTARLGVECTW